MESVTLERFTHTLSNTRSFLHTPSSIIIIIIIVIIIIQKYSRLIQRIALHLKFSAIIEY